MSKDFRPTKFEDIIGQDNVKEYLQMKIAAYKKTLNPVPHILLLGSSGLGKTTLANVFAMELGVTFHSHMATKIKTWEDFYNILKKVRAHDVLFIDEIHALPPKVQEALYSVMEDFKCPLLDKNLINPITVSIPKFTLIGATTHGGMIKGPLIGRFQYKGYLIDYNNEQLSGMAKNACRRIYGIDLPDTTASKMASTCKRTARNVYSMLRNLIDVAESDTRGMVFGEHLTPSMLLKTLKMERIDPYVGLDPISRKYLTVLLRENTSLGSRTIANMINEQEITVVYMIEPFLTSEIALEFKSNNMPKIINGPFVRITPKGRVITEAGRTYLSICRNLQHSGWFTGENLGNLENVYENTY